MKAQECICVYVYLFTHIYMTIWCNIIFNNENFRMSVSR